MSKVRWPRRHYPENEYFFLEKKVYFPQFLIIVKLYKNMNRIAMDPPNIIISIF